MRPDGERSDRIATGAQTVVRALEVLEVLRLSDRDVPLTEISEALALHSSTTHRILRALCGAGYVVRSSSRRYRLGREAYLLGRAAERDLRLDLAAPHLAHLRDATGESVNLVVREGPRALVLLRFDSPQPLRFAQETGTRLPLHCTSTGKVLLAFSADPEHEAAVPDGLYELTDATITSARTLAAELATVRESGYAVNLGERIEGVHGVAAPVLSDSATAFAAVAVQGPAVRIPRERVEHLGAAVIDTARRLSDILVHGYWI